MLHTYKQLFPLVHDNLDYWRYRANDIRDVELRKQALDSLRMKAFHCEGGSIFGYLVRDQQDELIRFIVAFQTISDYLDNLCDRSTSLDPKDFAALHQAMQDALTPDGNLHDYYAYRSEKEDNGYLVQLVEECRGILKKLPSYWKIEEVVVELNNLYNNLQIWKHIHKQEREEKLLTWFENEKHKIMNTPMKWYEFAASTGSTLGVFVLVAYAFRKELLKEEILNLKALYFPFIHGIHILLDYFIDLDEDEEAGDLNFCTYYDHLHQLYDTLQEFYCRAEKLLPLVPDRKFHRIVTDSMFGMYLSDPKVKASSKIDKKLIKKIRRLGGINSWFFYWNARIYRKFQTM